MNNNMTFTVQFDCTERLERVLGSIASGLHELAEMPRVIPEPVIKPEKAEKQRAESGQNKPQPKPEKVEEKVMEKPIEAPEPPAEAIPERAEPKSESDEISNEDLRAMVKACRERVLGNNINDAILKKALNDKLRDKVASYGFTSSTQLNQEQRREFKAFCESITAAGEEEEVPF